MRVVETTCRVSLSVAGCCGVVDGAAVVCTAVQCGRKVVACGVRGDVVACRTTRGCTPQRLKYMAVLLMAHAPMVRNTSL